MDDFKKIKNIIDSYYNYYYSKKKTKYKDIISAQNDVYRFLNEKSVDENTLLKLHLYYRHDLLFINNNMAGFIISFLASALFSSVMIYQKIDVITAIIMVCFLILLIIIFVCVVCKCVNTYKNVYFNNLVADVIEDILKNNKTKICGKRCIVVARKKKKRIYRIK